MWPRSTEQIVPCTTGLSFTYPMLGNCWELSKTTRALAKHHIPVWELLEDLPAHLEPSQSITYAAENFLRTLHIRSADACMCHGCMYATRTCINAYTDKCNRANGSDNLFSFTSAVHQGIGCLQPTYRLTPSLHLYFQLLQGIRCLQSTYTPTPSLDFYLRSVREYVVCSQRMP